MEKLKELRGRLEERRTSLHEIFSQAGEDLDMSKVSVIDGDTDAKLEKIRALNDEMNDLVDEIKGLEDLDGMRKRVAELDEPGKHPGHPEAGTKRREPVRSVGEVFVESPAFKQYTPGSGQGPIANLDVSLKTLFQTSAGWDPEVTRTGRVEDLPTRPAPHVVEFIPQTETGQAAVKYMEETTFTNAAAEKAEGATYPEAALALTQRSRDVEKIAVWLPVTDEQFEDEPRARDYVNNRLPFMLRQRLDSQVLVGDGVAPNLLGTEAVSGIQTQAKGADPAFDAVYKLFRKIRDDGFAEPSVFFVKPSVWEPIRLARTADGLYILGNPDQAAAVRLWGVPGVETTAAPAAKILAGDYRNFAELAVRRGVDVQVTNSHSDFFINGKLAVRADVRVAMVHYRPKAFGEVTGL